MAADVAALRRAYELGRLRVAATRSVAVATIVALAIAISIGRTSAVWALAPLGVLALSMWQGGALGRGAVRGTLAGLLTIVIPLAWLRPCCDAVTMAATGACCSMPSVCGVTGAILGLATALVWPRERSPRDHALAGLGVALGALSVAVARCSGLFLGESIGLALGLVAGIAVSFAARARLTADS
ncbi:MAG TPA: hypothetical protein VGH28_24925 [Polyangiaceae bacterium]|jgi:hypothetical protein